MVTSVLFVCTGNTCRSVMAEHLLRHYAREAGLDLQTASAGLRAYPGDEASEFALTVLEELGLDASGHRSRRVHLRLLEEHDLILAMTAQHKQGLLKLAPELAERVFLLKEFVERKAFVGQELGEWIEKDYEISDPFGQSLEVYRRSREEIGQEVQALVNYWTAGKEKTMKIVIGADHGGYQAKEAVREHLTAQGFQVEDFGTFQEESCDYPDVAHKVGQAVAKGEFDQGILICGTGIGMSLAANKVPGIRAALCQDTYSARMARAHNDSNVLCLGARVTGLGLMLDVVDTYLQGSFVGGRHARRVEKIEQVEK